MSEILDLKSRKHHVRQNCVYFLQNENKTYIGCTNNMRKRLKQHRRILPGGSRYTGTFKDYKKTRLIAFVAGFPDRSAALSYEYHCKQYCPVRNRIPNANPRFCGFFAPLMLSQFEHLHHRLTLFLVEHHDLAPELCGKYPLKDVVFVTEP